MPLGDPPPFRNGLRNFGVVCPQEIRECRILGLIPQSLRRDVLVQGLQYSHTRVWIRRLTDFPARPSRDVLGTLPHDRRALLTISGQQTRGSHPTVTAKFADFR